MNRGALVSSLPAYKGQNELLKKQQSVQIIIRELLAAHTEFAPHYDRIAAQFAGGSVPEVCERIAVFLKQNVRYDMEPEARQTIKSPAAILAHGHGDCKHYASFSGGVLDALNRRGANFNWRYRFASYNPFSPEPEHVFVIVKHNGREIWIDPTPGADKHKPSWQIDKKPKSMALYKISGMGNTPASYPVSDLLDDPEVLANPRLFWAIQLLLKYGVMNANAKIVESALPRLERTLPPAEFSQLLEARNEVRAAAIGGFFDTIWRGVKKVTLAAPRGAFLSLVAINAFGYATKLSRALYDDKGGYTAFKDRLKKTWQDRLGGDWTKLENTIRNGSRKRAILGAAEVAVPAWVTIAGEVIAAIMPLVNAFLKQRQAQTGINYDLDPTTGLPFGADIPAGIPGQGFAPQQQPGTVLGLPLPVVLIGGAAAAYFLIKKRS